MKMYALTMAENEITIYLQYGAMFTPDIVFDAPSLQLVPNKDRKMLSTDAMIRYNEIAAQYHAAVIEVELMEAAK